MTKHPRSIVGYKGSFRTLAKKVGNMQYDQVAAVYIEFANDISRQAAADMKMGHRKLARRLYKASEELYQAASEMGGAWDICKKYMK